MLWPEESPFRSFLASSIAMLDCWVGMVAIVNACLAPISFGANDVRQNIGGGGGRSVVFSCCCCCAAGGGGGKWLVRGREGGVI